MVCPEKEEGPGEEREGGCPQASGGKEEEWDHLSSLKAGGSFPGGRWLGLGGSCRGKTARAR